ncbi:glutathione S-transferase [Scheffersomyces xylosifermentans]|uniref:glutathione S-transferase n=1 Tax=Scheffersomyces xylosifermentans TaxID=1304137 RepID=UPI00315DDD27
MVVPVRDKFILHWLDQSRSHRVLWLFELLGLDYELRVYLRHPQTWRGPKELFDVHPTGKVPIVEVIFADGREPLKLAETGHIIQFILRYYDHNHILYPKNPMEQLKVDYYLHFSEGSIQPILITLLINNAAKSLAPFGLKRVTKIVSKGLNNGYYLHEWKLFMNFLEKELAKNGTGYFVGDKLSAADVILSFPIYENIFDNLDGVKECTGEKGDLRKMYPHLARWADMVGNDPSYIKVTDLMEERSEDLIRHAPRYSYEPTY